jgi:hypothetical protein
LDKSGTPPIYATIFAQNYDFFPF